MFEIDRYSFANICQRSVDSIEKCVFRNIILRSDPFALQNSPKGFGNVQLGRIWWKIEKEQSTLLPQTAQLFYFSVSVNRCIIKNHECVFLNFEREPIQKINDFICIDAFSCAESIVSIISIYHSEDVESVRLQRRDIDIFVAKLPSVGNIPFGTDVTFIGKVQIDLTVSFQLFKFLQLLGLVLIKLRRGNSPWAFSYSLISCANADKKRLKVQSLASFPVAFCQSSLALLTLCLSPSIALRTAASSEQSMIGLRPRPGRVCKPVIPYCLKRFTHELTDICDISVCSPISWLERPFDFRSTARQRIRKQWEQPLRKPSSNAKRCVSVNISILILPITCCLMMYRQSYKFSII